MAWNPSPKVAKAREIAEAWDCDQVIIIALSQERRTIQAVSYGKTPRLCAHAKDLAGRIYDAVIAAHEEGV